VPNLYITFIKERKNALRTEGCVEHACESAVPLGVADKNRDRRTSFVLFWIQKRHRNRHITVYDGCMELTLRFGGSEQPTGAPTQIRAVMGGSSATRTLVGRR
jgi:hypothetical protein